MRRCVALAASRNKNRGVESINEAIRRRESCFWPREALAGYLWSI